MKKGDKKGWNSRPDLDNLLEGFQIIGFDWKYLYLNNIALIQSRLEKKELVGKRFDEVWPGVEETELYRLIKNCLENKTAHHLENEFKYPDQTLGWFDLSIQPVPEGALILSVDITERKMVEYELRESEKKFRNLVWDMHVGVIVQGSGTEIILSNPAALELLGITENQLLGKTSFDPDWNVIQEDGSPFPGPTHPVAVAISSLKPVREVVMGVYRPLIGDRVWLLVDAFPQFNEDGTVRQVVCSFINITKQREAQESLKKSEDLFNRAFHSSPVSLAIVARSDRKFIAVNDTFLELTEFSRDEMIGYNAEEIGLIRVEDVIRIVTDLNEKGRLKNVEVSVWSKSGKPIHLLSSSENIELAGQSCSISTMTDITERKLAEKALIESETKFRKIYEEGPFGMALVNKEFRFLAVNNTFCQIIGYTENELQKLTFKDITISEDIAHDIQEVTRLINGEIPVYRTEKRYLRKNRSVMWGSLTVTANYDQDGQFLYNLAILEDITGRKQAEEEILKLNTDLESRVSLRTSQLVSVNNELEAFSYSVSHDLRAPVRSISGFTQILVEEYGSKLDDEGKRLCSIIQENSIRMGTLIDDLLAFSRLNRTELNKSVVNMKDLVSSAYKELTDEVSVKRIEFRLGEICNSAGDPKMLKQVWINLISNAIKYSSKKEKPIITIGSKKEDGYCVYHIKDNGVGFDMAYMDKLFGVFQRLHGQREFDGTGVGLAIVQRIIQRHGGRTWAKGEVDNGAEFYFSIPIVTEI